MLNNSGNVAFTGTNSLEASNTVWLEESCELRLVAYDGQQVPGAADGVQWLRRPGYPNLHLNAAGQLLFNLGLQGAGITSPLAPLGYGSMNRVDS